ncbi:MAG: hypothetical protein MJZ22_03800 [Candidatus Saccharibacteria bacterium]|nr:hypothetical protein [Candidatus Saccharibacteria bacterium]
MKNAMKIVLVGVMALFCVNEAVAGSFRDPRDGKTYKTVKMPDGNIWMAENLNYNMKGSMCYNNDAINCDKYGRLYFWYDAMDACPAGWHLPSLSDSQEMLNAVGDNKSKKLRSRSWGEIWTFYETVCAKYACSYGYGSTIRDCRGSDRCDCGSGESICLENKREKVDIDNRASDSFGFSALPAGYRKSEGGGFNELGSRAYFWSSTERNSDNGDVIIITEGTLASTGYAPKNCAYSIRCLKDTEAWIAKKRAEEEKKRVEEEEKKRVEEEKKRAEEEKKRAVMGSFKDPRDGKKYKTVKMPDGKTWMAENLNYKMEGSSCYEDYATNCGKYGRLYTWNAALKACPSGWRLPKKKDIEKMLAVVGTDDQERSRHLRTKHEWNVKADEADDAYYFSALPAGYYSSLNEEFNNLGYGAYFWSSTEYDSIAAYHLSIIYDGRASVLIYGKRSGSSVRCLQD